MGTKTRALTNEELSRFISVINNPPDKLLVYAAFAAVIIGTGARWQEVADMRVMDLFDNKLRPRTEIVRTLAKKRSAIPKRKVTPFQWDYFGKSIIAWRDQAVKKYFLKPDDRLFSVRLDNRRLSNGNCWINNRRLLKMAGIDPARVAFHGLRKSYLICIFEQCLVEKDNNWLAAVDHIKKLAGHEDINTTIIYLKDYICFNESEVSRKAFARVMRAR